MKKCLSSKLLYLSILFVVGVSSQVFAATFDGTISGIPSSPAQTVCVNLLKLSEGGQNGCETEWVDGVQTDGTEKYTFTSVDAGEYYLATDVTCTGPNNHSLVDEYWINGGEGTADCSLAGSFSLVEGEGANTDKDITLAPGAVIAGVVTGNPGVETCINIQKKRTESSDGCDTIGVSGTMTSTIDGSYTHVVPAGEYYISTDVTCYGSKDNPLNLLDEFWSDATGAGTSNCGSAGIFTANIGPNNPTNIALESGIVLSGVLSGHQGQTVCVNLYKQRDGSTESCETDYVRGTAADSTTGAFSIVAAPGNYYLGTDVFCGDAEPNNAKLIDEYWTADGLGTSDCSLAEQFTLSAEDNPPRAITLESGYDVTGSISGAMGQAVCVNLLKNRQGAADGCDTDWIAGSQTDGEGDYSFVAPAGIYYLATDAFCGGNESNNANLLDEYWVSGGEGVSDCAFAEEFTLDETTQSTPRDLALQPGAVLTGVISGNEGQVVCLEVSKLRDDGTDGCGTDYVTGGATDTAGVYSVVVPPGNNYYLQTVATCFGSEDNNANLVDEYWTEDSEGSSECSSADPFDLAAGVNTPKNIALQGGAIISGTVLDSNDNPLVDLGMMVSPAGCVWGDQLQTKTDNEGKYTFVVAENQDYKVEICQGCGDESHKYVLHEYWDGGEGTTDCNLAGVVSPTILGGEGENKDFVVEYGGLVSGFVYEGDGTTPITNEPQLRVDVYTGNPCDNNYMTGADLSGIDGSYLTWGVPAGDVYLKINWATVHPNAWWTTTGISGDCQEASPVTITAGVTASEKNFSLPLDTDGDDLSDADELIYGTDRNLVDSDGDGLGDADEVHLFLEYYGVPYDGDLDNDNESNIADTDMDGDGVSDLQELARGSDPTDKASKPSDLLLYDDFSGPTLDNSKWTYLEVVREIVAEKLYLGVRSDSLQRNYVHLVGAPTAQAFKTRVTLQPGVSVAEGGTVYAGIGGDYYNQRVDADDLEGNIDVSLYLLDEGNGLEAQFMVYNSTNSEGSAWSELSTEAITLSQALVEGATYALEILYDNTNNFTFNIYAVDLSNSTENLIGSDSYTGPEKGSAFEPSRTLKNKATKGHLLATFDNIQTGADAGSYSIYDDFSSTPLDQNKWDRLEFTRQIANGEARLLVHSDGNKERNYLVAKRNYPYVQATVTVDANSWLLDGAIGRITLMQSLYNDGFGPRSGIDYNGQEGDIWGQVNIGKRDDDQVYSTWAYADRSLDKDYDGYEEIMSRDFDLEVATSGLQRHNFFMGCAGDFIVIGIEDLASNKIEAAITPIDKNSRSLPFELFTALRAEVKNGDSGMQIALFDNVYVGGDQMTMKGDLNVDGSVDIEDVILGLQSITDSASEQIFLRGDVDGDSQIGLPDVISIINEMTLVP